MEAGNYEENLASLFPMPSTHMICWTKCKPSTKCQTTRKKISIFEMQLLKQRRDVAGFCVTSITNLRETYHLLQLQLSSVLESMYSAGETTSSAEYLVSIPLPEQNTALSRPCLPIENWQGTLTYIMQLLFTCSSPMSTLSCCKY